MARFVGQYASRLNTLIGNYGNWLLEQYISNNAAMAFRIKAGKSLAMIRQVANNVGGRNMTMPVQIGGSQSMSKDFAIAQALSEQAANRGEVGVWVGNNAKDYAVDRIGHEEMLKASKNTDAFYKLKRWQMNDKIISMWRKQMVDIWGRGNNVIFKVKAVNAAQKWVQVESPEQVNTIEKHGWLQFFSPKSGAAYEPDAERNAGSTISTLKTSSGDKKGYVVDRVERGFSVQTPPKIYFTAALHNSIAVGDLCCRMGDKGEPTIAGFQQWIPLEKPTATPFFNLDRTVEPERLGGFRRTLSGNESIHKNIDRLIAECKAITNGRGPTCLWMHPIMERMLGEEIATGVGNSIQYNNPANQRSAGFNFSNFLFNTADGQVPLYTDLDVPLTRVYGIDMDQVALYYLPGEAGGSLVDFVRGGNGEITQWKDTAQAYESRLFCYSQMFIPAPGANFVLETKDKTGFWI